jgi:hypothetical protein
VLVLVLELPQLLVPAHLQVQGISWLFFSTGVCKAMCCNKDANVTYRSKTNVHAATLTWSAFCGLCQILLLLSGLRRRKLKKMCNSFRVDSPKTACFKGTLSLYNPALSENRIFFSFNSNSISFADF